MPTKKPLPMFTPPPPRAAVKSRSSLTSLITVIAATILMGWGVTQLYDLVMSPSILAALNQRGVTTPATVTALTRGRRDLTAGYYVSYTYIDQQGQTHMRANEDIESSFFEKVQQGQPLTIRYLPENPSVARIVGQETVFTTNDLFVIAFTLLGLLVVFGRVVPVVIAWVKAGDPKPDA